MGYPVFTSVRCILHISDMKSLLWIVLFKLATTYGLYPEINAFCNETGDWPTEPDENPSALADLIVSLADKPEDSEMALNISWAVNIDYSNEYLRGTGLAVEGRHYLCLYHPPFNEVKINISGHEQLWFHFLEIPAMPNKQYNVFGCNLPTPMSGGSASKSTLFQTPDCSKEIMRQHQNCLDKARIESWEPNITSIFLNGQVEVSFMSSEHSVEYDLELWSCIALTDCNDSAEWLSGDKIFTNGKSRWTRTLYATGPCEALQISIMPSFPTCRGDCTEKLAAVDCKPQNWTFLLCLTFLIIAVALVAALKWYKVLCSQRTDVTPLVSVLVVYPAGNRPFQRAVVSFAEFLRAQWRFAVVVDAWERTKTAEQGPFRWLAAQMERVDRVVFVCTRRMEPWEITAGGSQLQALRDHAVPASTQEVFALALNALESQIQGTPILRKCCTVHLGDRPETKHLPAALRACKSFALMKDAEKLGRHLCGADQKSWRIPTMGLNLRPLNSEVARRLRDAIQELHTGGHL
ncbi:hypothetical protein GJAV_G00186470 [Gymnothorax javanicus]|nr:hypothetical protein GJAV_G00186470 [Gymnothorax javanicus]